jgi:hypothetical protein
MTMLTAVIAFTAFLSPPAINHDEAKLDNLSAARGQFVKLYRSSKKKRLQVTENLGTTGLGNPYRDWYFPAGSSSYQIWIVTYQACHLTDGRGRETNVPRSGALVYKSWHGRYSTTDWVVDLVDGKTKNVKGTIGKLLDKSNLKVKGKLTAAQTRLLKASHPYIGFDEDPRPGGNFLLMRFVSSNGESSKDTYGCDSLRSMTGSSLGGYRESVLYNLPILPEEAQFMGIHRNDIWRGKGKYYIEKNPQLY